MSLGGINTNYDSTSPPDNENAGLGATRIRSLETTVQQVLDSEHNFPAAGGANTGYHRLGSGRVFYDVQSNVSSSGTDGRLQVASDTSRLFHVGSGGTMYLGGANSISANSTPVGGQRFQWVQDFGEVNTGSQAVVTVGFANSGYSGIPFVQVSVVTTKVGSGGGFGGVMALPFVDSLTASGCRILTAAVNNSSFASQTNINVHWSSLCTRTL